MQITADLHIHSKHSRATSKALDLANLEKYARIKGVNLLGTADYTHPIWIKELKQNLTEQEGILKTKTGFPFVLQTEISLIYTQNNKGRRIHNVVLAPSFAVVDQITEYLLKHGRVDYDGRPIFKIPCPEFVSELKKISSEIEVIPAHIWTPHFSLFGAYNQFSTVEECFADQAKHIHALETGLSSDPAMNWRLSQLDKYTLVSFSDLHSFWPWRIGRESTIFDLNKLTYNNLIKALRTKQGLHGTMEISPLFGKYHLTGHRNCNISLKPKDALKYHNICPKCGKPLTVGVEQRVEELADRPEGFIPKDAKLFKTLIPLSEILAKLLNSGVATKKVWEEYYKLIKGFGTEQEVLLNASKEELEKISKPKIAETILKNREGKLKIKGGYDGLYGEIILDEEEVKSETEYKPKHRQLDLSNFSK